MGRRKGLRITSTDFNEHVVDHGEENDAYETQSQHTSKMQGPMAKNNKKSQNSNGEDNNYLKIREMRVKENQQRLRDLGVTNIVNSMTSLAQSHQKKIKIVKQNSLAGDEVYIPNPSDDSEEDCEQVARNAVISKKQHGRQYVSPMFLNRVANRTKLRRVVAPNVSKQGPTVTMSETNDGNKGTKRGMTLVDENNDEDDDIFQGNRVDMEVDDANQDYEYNGVDNTIHSNDQHDIQMENHVNFEDEEQLQGPEKEKEACYLKGKSIGRRKRLRITSTVSNERTKDHFDKDHVEDHHVFDTQNHETSEIQGASKNVRGYTQKAETWKMDSTQRIVVSFNKFGIPIGDEGNELVQFLGTLVRMPDHVSIEHSDWRKVPIRNKEDMYLLVKSKFVIHPNETNQIKKWILYSMGRKWRAWKGCLKARAYDPSLTVDEIVSQQVKIDNRLNPSQFKKLVTSWFTPEFQRTCEVKRSSRSKMKEPHVSGTKSFARLSHEMATNNNGVYPTRGELYIKTHTRKDGTIVDDKATHVVASLKDIANDSTITLGDPHDFTNDDYSRVKGPEKRGYIRLVGRMPTTKSNVAASTDSETIDQLKSVVSAMAVVIQENIPNANLSSVLSNLNIQVPAVGSCSITTLYQLTSMMIMGKKGVWIIDFYVFVDIAVKGKFHEKLWS